MVLCQTCHDKVDRDEIKINGWLETSNGRKFDYEINSLIIKKTKYTDELKKYIIELKNSVANDQKMAIIKIKEKFDTKVSSKSILNIWNNLN